MPIDPVTAFSIGGAILGGLGTLGTSPQEEAAEQALGRLQGGYDWLKEVPFSKDEIMGELLPIVQRMYQGAADVAAGRLGAAVGEADIAGGQPAMEYYLQTLAPVIAQGQQLSAGAVSEFGKWYSNLDAQAKNRFLQAVNLEMTGAGQLPGMNAFQEFGIGALRGADIGSTVGGNIATAGAIKDRASLLQNIGTAQVSGTPITYPATTPFEQTGR